MLLLAACISPFPCADDQLLDAEGRCHDAETDTDTDTDADSDTDTDADSDSDTDADTDADTDTDPAPIEDGWPTRFVAPYVDATAYPTVRIGEIPTENGVYRYTLGFVVAESNTSCTASWGTYYDIETGPSAWADGAEYFLYDQLETLRTLDGDVMVSFGGAANTPLEAACGSAEEAAAEYARVIDALSLTRIDFDVEGAWLADDDATALRNAALVALQADFRDAGRPLHVWFTLPVLPTGLTADGVEVVQSAVDAGVELDGVNVMTMDYGESAAPDPDGNMGSYGIAAIEALHAQLAAVWPDATEAEVWQRIGTTPMIGVNDVAGEVFTLDDAAQTREHAEDVGVGMLGFWSVNRDHPCDREVEWAKIDCHGFTDIPDWSYADTFAGYGE